MINVVKQIMLRNNKYGFDKFDCCKVAKGICPVKDKTKEELAELYNILGCHEGFSNAADERYCIFLAAKLLSKKPEDRCFREVGNDNARHRRCIREVLFKRNISVELVD